MRFTEDTTGADAPYPPERTRNRYAFFVNLRFVNHVLTLQNPHPPFLWFTGSNFQELDVAKPYR
jgi:hypothetical protein